MKHCAIVMLTLVVLIHQSLSICTVAEVPLGYRINTVKIHNLAILLRNLASSNVIVSFCFSTVKLRKNEKEKFLKTTETIITLLYSKYVLILTRHE